jgi:hypothetical protein
MASEHSSGLCHKPKHPAHRDYVDLKGYAGIYGKVQGGLVVLECGCMGREL